MLTLILLVLILPGLVFAYAFLARPLLHKVPALKQFYDEADGFWAKVWALCGRSVTILWSYILAAIGSGFELIDPLAKAVGDPDLKAQVTNALQSHPDVLGYFALLVSIVTIAARLRSLGKAA